MASKEKVTVSLNKTLALKHRRRRQLEEELKEGYRAMATADRATARQNLRAGWEAIKMTVPELRQVNLAQSSP